MIARIVNDLVDPALKDQFWIDHYGGLTVPITLDSPKSGGGTFDHTYPYSCHLVTEECKKDRKYLVPNKNKKSVAYWEALTETSPIEDSAFLPGPDGMSFTQDLRLVLWWNPEKMGYEDLFGLRSGIIAAVLKEIDGRRYRNTKSPSIKVAYFESTMINISNDRDETIFSEYSYFPEYKSLFKKPYDWIAFDFRFTWHMWKNCLPELENRTALEC